MATDNPASRKGSADRIVVEAARLANTLDLTLAGHDGRACVYALGWCLGAYVAGGRHDEVDLDRLLDLLAREARRKFAGVRDGSWPNSAFVQEAGRA